MEGTKRETSFCLRDMDRNTISPITISTNNYSSFWILLIYFRQLVAPEAYWLGIWLQFKVHIIIVPVS